MILFSYVDVTTDLTEVPNVLLPDQFTKHMIEEYARMAANRDEVKRGMYSMKEISNYFELHYSRISRIIKQLFEQEAKGKICPH